MQGISLNDTGIKFIFAFTTKDDASIVAVISKASESILPLTDGSIRTVNLRSK